MELDGREGTGESTREVAKEKQRAPIAVEVRKSVGWMFPQYGTTAVFFHRDGESEWHAREPSE